MPRAQLTQHAYGRKSNGIRQSLPYRGQENGRHHRRTQKSGLGKRRNSGRARRSHKRTRTTRQRKTTRNAANPTVKADAAARREKNNVQSFCGPAKFNAAHATKTRNAPTTPRNRTTRTTNCANPIATQTDARATKRSNPINRGATFFSAAQKTPSLAHRANRHNYGFNSAER